jgi:cell division protein ZapE
LDAAAERAQEEGFVAVAGETGESAFLDIEGRSVRARRHAPGVAWFDFKELCDGPRGTADYIELARRYHTVLISGVPQFAPASRDSMRRFTWLVDEFYDRHVNLMLSAAVAAEHLYDAVTVTPDIERTRSRLIEMQSTEYLSLAHLA